jgi:hypothetical protein
VRISVLDRNGLLAREDRNAFRHRARLGLGKFASEVASVILQAGVSNVPRIARNQPLLVVAILKNQERITVSSEWNGDSTAIALAMDRLSRAVGLKLKC